VEESRDSILPKTSKVVLALMALLSLLAFLARVVDVPSRALPRMPTAPPVPADTVREGRLLVRVQTEDKSPLSGAAVRVLWEKQDRYYEAARNVTDAEGQIRFEHLPEGASWVIVDATGFARVSTRLVVEQTERRAEVTVQAAQQLAVTVTDDEGGLLPQATVLVTTGDPLPFGALTDSQGVAHFDRLGASPWTVKASHRGYESVTRTGLDADTTIALRRLSTLSVRVELPNGEPAVKASVWIAGSSLWPARRAETAENGEVRVAGLLAGQYDVRATLGDLVSDTVGGLDLARGADKGLTLRLMSGRQVAVRVVEGDEEGAPGVSGADVVLVESGLSSFPLRARTGTDGRVLLGPIAPGPASVSASAEGFVGRGLASVPEEAGKEVVIALLKGGAIEGEVVDHQDRPVDGASVEIIGTDLGGFPIAETPMSTALRRAHFAWALDASPTLVPAGELGVMPGPIPPIPPPSALDAFTFVEPSYNAGPGAFAPSEGISAWVTGLDGRFVAKPVTPGRVRAIVRHPAYVEGISEVVSLAPDGRAKVKVVLLAGGSLEGRVVDKYDRGISGARVDLTAVRGTLERTTLTASDGSFAFAAVPAEVVLSVFRPDDLSRAVVRKSVEVGEGKRETITIELPEGRDTVRVRVRDDEGNAVDTAQVSVVSLDPDVPLRQTVFTLEDGSAVMTDARGLALLISVEAPGFARASRSVEAAPEELTIQLARGVIVQGKVTAVRGRTYLAGAAVTLFSQGRRWLSTTNTEGVFRFQDVPPGSARVTVSHADYATAEQSFDVQRTGRLDREFEVPTIDLSEPGSIEGKVVDAAGQPVSGARVGVGTVPAFLPAGALPSGLAVTDARGHFTLNGVLPGDLVVEAYAPDVGRGSARVKTSSQSTTRGVVIRLAKSATDDDPTVTGSLAITLGERDFEDGTDVVIVHVAQGSEAERAGLSAGDIVRAVDGRQVDSMHDTRARISGRPGSDVLLSLWRAGAELSLRVTRENVRR
jgi:protocatechuate 3,4-dioxygenase beta subunit